MSTTQKVKIIIRNGTANYTGTLSAGELFYNSSTKKLYIGDGSTAIASLPYFVHLSQTDKDKLDGIATGATKVTESTVSGWGFTKNTGTVTSVRVQATSPVVSSSNTAATTTLNTTISLANGYGDTKNPYASKTANYVLAAPNGSNGAPSFRALVAADIPNLAASKITSGTFDAARIPGLAASKITSGTLDKSRLPSLYGTDLYGPAEDTEDGSAYLLSNGGGGTQSQWVSVSTILDGYATTSDLSAYATQDWVTGKGYTTNKGTVTKVNIGSTSYTPTTAGVISLPVYPTIPTSLKNPNSLGIKVNSETSAFVTYDGSAAKTITIKPSTTSGAFTISDGSTTKTIQLAGKFTDTVYTLPSQYSNTIVSDNVIKLNQINAPSTPGGSTYGQGTSGQVLKSNGDTIYWGPDNNTTYSVATASALGLVKSSTTGTTSNRDYKVQINSDGTMKVNVPWTNTDTNTTYDLRLSAYDDDANLTTSTADPAINLFDGSASNRIKLASSDRVSVSGNNKVVTFDLKSSGASAGSYGTSANATPEFGDSFNIPYITIDKYGRITSISNKAITIPSYEASETVGRPGLMTVADRQHLDSMWSVWSADGTDDTLVNKVQEVLKVFENYPEATSLIDTFATKSDVGHKHTYSKTTSVTLSGADSTSTGAIKYLEGVTHTAATLTGTKKFNTDAIKKVELSASSTPTDGPAYLSKITGTAPSLTGDTTFLKSITINGGSGGLSADDQETNGIKYMSDVTLTPAAATTTIAAASEDHTHNVTVSGTTGNNSGTGVTSVNASYTTGRLTLTATTSAPNTHTHAYGSSTTPIATTACSSTVGAISAISGGSLTKSYKYLHHSHTAATLGTPTTGTVSITGGEYEGTTKYMKVTSTAASTGTVGISGGSVSPTVKYLTATPGNTNTSTGADN